MEPLEPAEGSKPGDKVFVESYEQGEPDKILNPKKKIWEQLQVHLFSTLVVIIKLSILWWYVIIFFFSFQVDLKVSNLCEAQWQSNNLQTNAGKILSKSLKNVHIS